VAQVTDNPLLSDSRLIASSVAWLLLAVLGAILLLVLMRRRAVGFGVSVGILVAFLAVSASAVSRSLIEIWSLGDTPDLAGLETARWVVIIGRAAATVLLLGVLMHMAHRPRWLLGLFR